MERIVLLLIAVQCLSSKCVLLDKSMINFSHHISHNHFNIHMLAFSGRMSDDDIATSEAGWDE